MHKSGLHGISIDCQIGSGADDLEVAARFWAEALHLPVAEAGLKPNSNYLQLSTGPGGLNVEVQRVKHPSRVHLDIESDDVEAEVKRLERLGARIAERVEDWVVMEAPTGHRFCVVRGRYRSGAGDGGGSP